MVRIFAVAATLSCLATFAWAQTQPAPGPAAAQTATPAPKAAAKKLAPKAKANSKLTEPTENGPCGIGVISAIGDQFTVQKIGFTVFGNEQAQAPIDSWGLNDLVVARVRAAAGPGGGAVRRIAYARDAFTRTEQSGSLFRDAKVELGNAVRQIATGSHCGRYVLVQGATRQFSNLNLSVHGVGIVNWGNPIKDHTYLFALSYIRIYDGQSFEVIKQGAASTDDESLMSRALMLQPVRGPSRELDNASFPSAPTEAVGNPALRDGVRALLTTSLDKTLPGMLGRQEGDSK